MTASKNQRLRELLTALETAMRAQGQWSAVVPPHEALQSQEPFCIDTLDFAQWLQFVMIPRFESLLDSGAALPTRCAIAPVAEEYFQTQPDASTVLSTLTAIDELLTEA